MSGELTAVLELQKADFIPLQSRKEGSESLWTPVKYAGIWGSCSVPVQNALVRQDYVKSPLFAPQLHAFSKSTSVN